MYNKNPQKSYINHNAYKDLR